MAKAETPRKEYESLFISKFGVSPFTAIPTPFRPPSEVDFSFTLLAWLGKLASRDGVNNVSAFRRRLLRARGQRAVQNEAVWQNYYIEKEDVRLAIAQLDDEERQATADQNSKASSPKSDQAATNKLMKNPQWGRTRETAAVIKREVNNLNPVRNDGGDTIHVAKNLSSTRFSKKSSSSFTPASTDSSAPSTDSTKPGGRRLQSAGTGVNSIRRPPRHAATEERVPSPPRKRARSSKRSSGESSESSGRGLGPRPSDHWHYFKKPKHQHVKSLNPKIIKDISQITDVDTLDYPVEIPIANRKGELHEINNPDIMRRYLDKLKRQASSSVSTRESYENPTASTSFARNDTNALRALRQRYLEDVSKQAKSVTSAVTGRLGDVDHLLRVFVENMQTTRNEYEQAVINLSRPMDHTGAAGNFLETAHSGTNYLRRPDEDTVLLRKPVSHFIDLGSPPPSNDCEDRGQGRNATKRKIKHVDPKADRAIGLRSLPSMDNKSRRYSLRTSKATHMIDLGPPLDSGDDEINF